MRITQNMMTNQFIYNITNQNQQMQTLENELSTGKSLNKPSDNPLAVSQDMAIRTTLSETTSYQSTISSGLSWLQNTSSAIQQIQTALQSLQSTLLEGINATNQSPSTMQALSETAQQLSSTIYQELNAKQGNRFLFGGLQTGVAPAAATAVPYSTVSTSDGSYYSIPGTFTTMPSNSGITSTGGSIATAITDQSNTLANGQPYALQLSENVTSQGTITAGTLTLLNQFTGAVLATGSAPTNIQVNAQSGSIATLTFTNGSQGTPPKQLAVTLGTPVTSVSGTAGSFTMTDALVPTGNLAASDAVSTGSSGTISYNVAPSVDIPVNVTASDLMLSGSAAGSSLQQTLQQISTNLLTGNTSALQNDLSNLQANMSNVTNVNANVGSRIQRLTVLQNQMNNYQTTLTNQKGVIQGANMAQVISQFNTDQTTFTAALKMGAQILLPSLVSYLP